MGITNEPNCRCTTLHVLVLLFKGPIRLPNSLCLTLVIFCVALPYSICLASPIALNITTTSTSTFTTFSNLDNSTHDYFPNYCCRVVKHMNQYN
jgi:hypothetical protein